MPKKPFSGKAKKAQLAAKKQKDLGKVIYLFNPTLSGIYWENLIFSWTVPVSHKISHLFFFPIDILPDSLNIIGKIILLSLFFHVLIFPRHDIPFPLHNLMFFPISLIKELNTPPGVY